jgi:hypothetical protein
MPQYRQSGLVCPCPLNSFCTQVYSSSSCSTGTKWKQFCSLTCNPYMHMFSLCIFTSQVARAELSNTYTHRTQTTDSCYISDCLQTALLIRRADSPGTKRLRHVGPFRYIPSSPVTVKCPRIIGSLRTGQATVAREARGCCVHLPTWIRDRRPSSLL